MKAGVAVVGGMVLSCGMLGTPQAWAATTCGVTMTSLSFGQIDVTGFTTATATATVTCSTTALTLLGNTKVRMCLNIGKATAPRSMPNAQGDPLEYQMYQSAAYSTIWGSSTGTAPANIPYPLDLDYAVPLLGGSTTQNLTLYGRIAPQTAAAAGTFTHNYAGTDTSVVFQSNTTLLVPASYPATCTSGGTTGASSAFAFSVTATVPPSCVFSATTDLDFGSQPGAITSVRDNTSTITMACRNRTAWNLGLDNGLNFGSGTRRMQWGATGNYVSYQLYRDSQRSAAWGETIGTNTATGSSTGSAQTLTVYGRVPAPQNVPAGDYKDTVKVTVTY